MQSRNLKLHPMYVLELISEDNILSKLRVFETGFSIKRGTFSSKQNLISLAWNDVGDEIRTKSKSRSLTSFRL